jgi:hypothetical protein
MSTLDRAASIPFFKTTLLFRAFWIAVATFGLNALVSLGTPPAFVATAGILGLLITSRVAHTRLTSIGFFVALLGLVATNSALFWLIHEGARLGGATGFGVDEFQLHVGTCLISAIVWSITTWIFWRARLGIIVETVVTLLGGVLLFASHRDFHLDQPKIVSSLAWRLGMDHLAMLIVVGSSLLVLGIAYLYCASLATRPLAERERVQRSTSKRQWLLGTTLAATVIAILYIIQQMVYAHFNAIMLARVANGVGMNSESGVSPLSFQSALGSTNQPAALVRLEGDYSNNPFSPMMYMRESALSSFNGKEMVFAGRAYDSDLPVTGSRDTFSRQEDAELGQRTPLVQSVYLLAEHDHAFAVDYPVSIVQLKNPRPNRFKATYRAYSVAPAYSVSQLSSTPVGDPRWTPDVREHYLALHPDRRYSDLAREVTKDASQPIEKMLALTNYLSRTAIYTLTPNHTVKPDEDPVAPFLFGDHRGYCVHFAHALVYMARSLDIPARIGTGYLTDLSQAKDGHILLRMSDRHAWAEVFIAGIGWVPFDVQPDQVESHAETQVDSKLLEELMGVLEPGEEILPTDTSKDEPGMQDPEPLWTPSRHHVVGTLLPLLTLCVIFKILLREGWRIAPSPQLKLRWGYISLASFLHDAGLSREYGETRSEFANRSPRGLLRDISELLVTSAYSKTSRPSSDRVLLAIMRARAHRKAMPLSKRVIALLNPGSLVKTITGGKW